MGQSESKTQEILTNKIGQMTGKEILEAAGGIHTSCHIVPDKSTYNFGENVTGTVTICLSKPIFFVDEGIIQLTLEGKEVFTYEDTNNPAGISIASHGGAGQTVNHVDKFYRSRQTLYNS